MVWREIDAVFVGGTTSWKLSQHAEKVCFEARRRGKWVHMGRVNSLRRMQIAADFGCQSVDGTYLKYKPSNIYNILRWLDTVERKPGLFASRWT